MIDPIDDQILHILSANGRTSSEGLAREGLLRIVGLVNSAALGLSVAALIACNVEHEHIDEVVQMLCGRSEVRWVSPTTGRFDVIAFARFRSTEDLLSFIQSKLTRKAGVSDSETFICLKEAKGWSGEIG